MYIHFQIYCICPGSFCVFFCSPKARFCCAPGIAISSFCLLLLCMLQQDHLTSNYFYSNYFGLHLGPLQPLLFNARTLTSEAQQIQTREGQGETQPWAFHPLCHCRRLLHFPFVSCHGLLWHKNFELVFTSGIVSTK